MNAEKSSFRDPSGVVYRNNGEIYRLINSCYAEQFDRLMSSGLYESLTKQGLIIEHRDAPGEPLPQGGYKVIKPKRIPFISYPYEWCFGQLKDAALATLRLHRAALEKDMILKDASAYNIQFLNGRPVLIDTLSFDFYKEGEPWCAYGQFCRHFLAPLMLMCYVDMRMNRLLELYIDGIPLDIASTLLKGKGGFAAKQHIHWHAKSIAKHSSDGSSAKSDSKALVIKKSGLIAITDSLIRIVDSLKPKTQVTEWGNYYDNTNYSSSDTAAKSKIVSDFLKECAPESVWDLGANDGRYSRLALDTGANVVAFDIDFNAVENGYQYVKKEKCSLLPLVFDLTNPSPAIGFANAERETVAARQRPDCILALAIIHHMAISNNLPLPRIAEWLSSLCRELIIEFVPKTDSQVQTLLKTRADIFPDYTEDCFTRDFSQYFELVSSEKVGKSERTLFLFKSKVAAE